MSSNWNVYKIFKSGKRAKAPLHSFTFEGDHKEATEYFNTQEIKNLSEKFKKKFSDLKYRIIDSESSYTNVTKTEEEIYDLRKRKVLSKFLREKNLPTDKNYSTGLVYTKETNWKWQWAILQAATNNYIMGLSPCFQSYEEAESWMKTEIKALYIGK